VVTVVEATGAIIPKRESDAASVVTDVPSAAVIEVVPA
jgi:hypothetical protein